MKAILEFDLPEDEDNHRAAINGANWESVCLSVADILRNWIKHGHSFKSVDEALEKTRDTLFQEIENAGLFLS